MALAIGSIAQSANAIDYVWTRGSAANNNWDNALNWAGSVAPPVAPTSPDTTNIIFSGTAASPTTTSALRQDYSIDSLTFASDFVGSGTSSVAISTQSTLLTGATSAHLTIGAGGITSNVTSFNLTIQRNGAIPSNSAMLIVPVNQTWATNAPAASTGAITFSVNRIISGAGRVTKTGTGVLVLGSADPSTGWTGGIDLVEGSIRTGGLTGGNNGQFGTGSISHTSANDVSITASTVSAAGGGGDRLFDNDLVLGGTGRLTLGGSFNLGFTANSEWTLLSEKRLGTSFVTNHDGTITGAGGLNKLGGGMLVLNGANSYAGTTAISEGVVHVRNSTGLGTGSGAVTVVPLGTGTIGAALELSNDITVAGHPLSISGNGVVSATPPAGVDANAGALRNRSGNNTWSGPVTVTDPNTYVAIDAGELNLSGGVGGVGSMRVAGAGVLRAAHVRTAGLQIDGVTRVSINPDGTSAGRSTVSTLTLAGTPSTPTATLDLTNNALVIDYTGASVADDVRALIVAGRAGGAWTGAGLTSSTAAATAARALGYAEAADLSGSVPAIFGSVDATAILVRYTIVGDADLSGAVNFDDLLRLAQNYDAVATGKVWSQGDSNYDGKVNFDDLLGLAQNYNAVLSQAQHDQLAGVAGEAFANAAALSLVPEPALISGLALAGLLRRSRK